LRNIPSPHSAADQGFTLLELLIVCLLITISLAMSVPNLRTSLVSDQLAAGSRKIISLITSSRSRAVMNHEPYLIFFDPAEQKIWYRKAGDKGDEIISRHSVTLPSGIRIEEIKQASGGSEQDPMKDGLWISKQGYMDKTLIRLIDTKNRSINLLISPFLFTIETTDGPVDFD
jgi:prepilin-type N-terminal cleavage/methylation domain-containing protein